MDAYKDIRIDVLKAWGNAFDSVPRSWDQNHACWSDTPPGFGYHSLGFALIPRAQRNSISDSMAI